MLDTFCQPWPALKGLMPSGGAISAAVVLFVLVIDVAASIASSVAALIGGTAPRRLGYASSMTAMLGGILWLLAAVPHALFTGVCVGVVLGLLGFG